jgi:hypothetical protein
MEQWGKDTEENLVPLLGLVRAPSDSTVRRILQGIDPEALREVLRKSAAMILSDKRKLAAARRLEATAAAGGAEIALETGDALYTNSSDAARTVEEGGHCLLKVERTRPRSSMTSSSASPTTPDAKRRTNVGRRCLPVRAAARTQTGVRPPSPTKAGRPISATVA